MQTTARILMIGAVARRSDVRFFHAQAVNLTAVDQPPGWQKPCACYPTPRTYAKGTHKDIILSFFTP